MMAASAGGSDANALLGRSEEARAALVAMRKPRALISRVWGDHEKLVGGLVLSEHKKPRLGGVLTEAGFCARCAEGRLPPRAS